MTTPSLRDLHADHRFIHVLLATTQHLCWEHAHVEGGADSSVILTYIGTGHGAPGYLSRSLTRWNSHPDHGWIPVAVVHPDGTITHPADENTPVAAATDHEGTERFGNGVSTSESKGSVK